MGSKAIIEKRVAKSDISSMELDSARLNSAQLNSTQLDYALYLHGSWALQCSADLMDALANLCRGFESKVPLRCKPAKPTKQQEVIVELLLIRMLIHLNGGSHEYTNQRLKSALLIRLAIMIIIMTTIAPSMLAKHARP